MARWLALVATLAVVVAALSAVSGCTDLGGIGCDAGIGADALPETAQVGEVLDVRDYCGDPGASTWRGWVLAPKSGTTARQAQAEVVAGLRSAGWRPLQDDPPIARGFNSLCRPGLFATVFTAAQASRAEDSQQFINEAPLPNGDLQVDIGRSTDGCVSVRPPTGQVSYHPLQPDRDR